MGILGGGAGAIYALGAPAIRIGSPLAITVLDLHLFGVVIPCAFVACQQVTFPASLFGSKPNPDKSHSYWFVTFRSIPEEVPAKKTWIVREKDLKELIEKYIEEKRIFVKYKRKKEKLKNLRLELETLGGEILNVRRTLKLLGLRKSAGFRIRLDKNASDFLKKRLGKYFSERWERFLGELSEHERKTLKKEFGSLKKGTNLQRLLKNIEPYLEEQ